MHMLASMRVPKWEQGVQILFSAQAKCLQIPVSNEGYF